MRRQLLKLVELLNSLDYVWVADSGIDGSEAFIYLYCEKPSQVAWMPAASLAAKLAKVLADAGSYDTDIALEWTGDKDMPFVSIGIIPEQLKLATTILSDHKSEFFYDT